MNPKKLFLSILTIGIIALAPAALAQTPGVTKLLVGGTTFMHTLTTNAFIFNGVTNQLGSPSLYPPTASNLVASVASYDNVGFTWQFSNPVGSTNGTVNVKVYKSFDNGVVYESTPSFVFTYTPPASAGAATWTTNANLSIAGVTHLGFSVDNNTVGDITNCLLEINDKMLKVGAVNAAR